MRYVSRDHNFGEGPAETELDIYSKTSCFYQVLPAMVGLAASNSDQDIDDAVKKAWRVACNVNTYTTALLAEAIKKDEPWVVERRAAQLLLQTQVKEALEKQKAAEAKEDEQ